MRYTKEADIDIQLARMGIGLSMSEAINQKKENDLEKEALHNYNLEKCQALAFFAMTAIGATLNQYKDGEITKGEVIEQVQEYRDRFFQSVDEQELKKHISRFEVERIWNNSIRTMRNRLM